MALRIRIPAILIIGFLILQSASLVYHDSSHAKPLKADTVISAQTGKQYEITLVEHGLPPGMTWFAYIGSISGSNYSGNSETSTGSTITYYEFAGSYSFSAGANGPYLSEEQNIRVTVTNYPVTVNITFAKQFNVSVTERGLPQGFPWGFDLTGLTNKNNNGGIFTPPFRKTLSEYISNGTYSLSVGTSLGPVNSILGTVKNITVDGSPVDIQLNFYRVNITAVHLKNGTGWGIPYSYTTSYSNGTTGNYSGYYPGKNRSLILYLPNATYSIKPVALNYYSPTMRFTMDAHALNLSETFQRGYSVTFVEEGRAASLGIPWQVGGFPVVYDETPYAITPFASRSYQVPNGTFNFNATVPVDYVTINNTMYEVQGTLGNTNSTFTVHGSNITIYLDFNLTLFKEPANPSGGNLFKSPPFYFLALGAFIATATAILLYFTKRRGSK